MSPNKETQKSAKSTTATSKKFKGFTDEERAAMKDHVQEMKASADRGPRADKADVRGHLDSSDSGLRNRSLQTRCSPSAEFSPHRADDAEDPQEGDDLVVMQLGRIEEICELDERPIRDRADDHARRPERDQDRDGSPPRLHETV